MPLSSPPDTGGPCLTHVGAARDLPLAALLLEVEPRDLLNLSHGLSLSGQLRIGPPWGRSIITRGQSPAPPFFRSPFIPITVLLSRSPPNENGEIHFNLPAGSFAFSHVHPDNGEPNPSPADIDLETNGL